MGRAAQSTAARVGLAQSQGDPPCEPAGPGTATFLGPISTPRTVDFYPFGPIGISGVGPLGRRKPKINLNCSLDHLAAGPKGHFWASLRSQHRHSQANLGLVPTHFVPK